MNIGIDIGGTNTVWGIVNANAKIIAKGKISTAGYKSVEDYIDALHTSLTSSIEKVDINNIKGIGVGAPNGNFHTGNIEFAPNLPWRGVIPLTQLMQKKFSLPTTITNDANAAAMGEMKYGAAKGVKDFIMVTLGTGVGSGFVCNGELVYGHDGLAGELGHITAIRNGRVCGCGRKGCLETYTSATGIVKTAYTFLKENKNSCLALETELNSHKIYLAAEKGDETALKIFEYTGKILGQSLADAVAITSPKLIVLFGGLARAEKYIFEPTKRHFEENLLRIYQNKIAIVPSELPENEAAVLGAAALI